MTMRGLSTAVVCALGLALPLAGQQLDFIDRTFVIAGAYATSHHAFDNTNCFVHIDRQCECLP